MTKKDKEKPDVEAEENEKPEEAPEEKADAAEEVESEATESGEAEGEEAPEEQAPEEKIADLNDKLLRALAEAENVRRRAQRDKEDAAKYAISNFARDMLPVADNMRRAMDSVDAETRKNDPAVEQVMVGLEMTERAMLATFERFGIETIDAMGCKFDHNFHEAMFEMDDPSKPHGTVVQVVETGYVLNGRLLRPAKVGVSKGGPKEGGPKENGDATKQETPPGEDDAAKEGQTAYEGKGEEPGQQLDEEL